MDVKIKLTSTYFYGAILMTIINNEKHFEVYQNVSHIEQFAQFCISKGILNYGFDLKKIFKMFYYVMRENSQTKKIILNRYFKSLPDECLDTYSNDSIINLLNEYYIEFQTSLAKSTPKDALIKGKNKMIINQQ